MYRYTSIDNDPVVQGTSHCLEISIAIALFFPFTSCCFFGELCIIVKTERSWLLRRCTVAVNRPSWDLRTIWINKNAWILLFKNYCRFGWYLHEKKKMHESFGIETIGTFQNICSTFTLTWTLHPAEFHNYYGYHDKVILLKLYFFLTL